MLTQDETIAGVLTRFYKCMDSLYFLHCAAECRWRSVTQRRTWRNPDTARCAPLANDLWPISIEPPIYKDWDNRMGIHRVCHTNGLQSRDKTWLILVFVRQSLFIHPSRWDWPAALQLTAFPSLILHTTMYPRGMWPPHSLCCSPSRPVSDVDSVSPHLSLIPWQWPMQSRLSGTVCGICWWLQPSVDSSRLLGGQDACGRAIIRFSTVHFKCSKLLSILSLRST